MKPTIRMIAENAGVSRGTVDKVLNNRIGVSDDVRKRVQEIADAMGYQPNPAGKALAFQKNPIRIGLVLLSGTDPIFTEIRAGAEAAIASFADFGFQLLIEAMAYITPDEQIRCIDKLLAEKVSGIILSPLENEKVRDKMKSLSDAGIPVVTINSDVEGVERLCFVGQDLVKSGRIAGELMGKLNDAGGPIAILSGLRSIQALRDRIQGFCRVLEERYPLLQVVETVEDIVTEDEAYEHVCILLQRHPNLKGVFITAKGITGACRALKEANRTDLAVICYDVYDDTASLLSEGLIDFTITQNPYQQGFQPVRIMYEALFQNRKPKREIVHTPLQILCRENI